MLNKIVALFKVKETPRFKYIGNKKDVATVAFFEGFTVSNMILNKKNDGAYLSLDAHFADPRSALLVSDMKYLQDHVDGVLQDFANYILKEFGTNVLITEVSADGKEILNPEARDQIMQHMKQTVPALFIRFFNYFMGTRRKRLGELFEMPTYRFIVKNNENGGFQTGIQCLMCGSVSFNENDIKNLYCGYCHTFHERIEK